MAKSKCSFWNGGKRSKLLLDIKLKDLRNEIYTFDFKVLQSFKPYALRKEFKSQRGGGNFHIYVQQRVRAAHRDGL